MNRHNAHLLLLCLLSLSLLVGCGATHAANPSKVAAMPPATQPTDDVIQQMLSASGMDQFDKLIEIQFTFNVRKADSTISRKWTWNPRQDKVTLTHAGPVGEEVTLSYIRGDLTSNADTKHNLQLADRWFINDSFWLMTPLHLSWQDRSKLTVTDHGMAAYPLGEGQGRHVTIAFPKSDSGGGGYTPGDIYELFLAPSNLITEWIYRKGGQDKPSLTNTFENYTKVGLYQLALNHENPNGFKLWFSDVKVVTSK
jgi:hypothetical protein